MDNMAAITKQKMERKLSQLNCAKVLGITQEENQILGWFNDANGSTHVITLDIPFYDTYQQLKSINKGVR